MFSKQLGFRRFQPGGRRRNAQQRRQFRQRAGWLPRAKWLHKKRFWHAVGLIKRDRWLWRREKWLRRNKRPFWKRKSFKRLRAEQNIINGLFFISKKFHGMAGVYRRKRYTKKILFRRYYRYNTAKRDFKTRIILRHYWKYRYSQYTHNKLQKFLSSVQRKSQRLFRFFCKFELVLFRYARWWGLTPSFAPDHISQYFVSHGYIYVNFISEVNPWYCVKVSDCIFSVAPLKAVTDWFFYSKYETLYGHSKFKVGRKDFSQLWRDMTAPLNISFFTGRRPRKKMLRQRWLTEHYLTEDRLYLKLRSLLSVSTWATKNLLHYSTLLEVSHKIKLVISIIGHEWFTIAFGAVRGYNDTNTVLTNKFISCSYF